MGYVYKADRTFVEKPIWEVGYYKPSGEWVTETKYTQQAAAVLRVNLLNGGPIITAHSNIIAIGRIEE